MIPYPLTRSNRLVLARAFATVPRVDIVIQCILEDQHGMAYVDSAAAPRAFIITDGFFHYFAGDFTSESGKAMLRGISSGLLMAGVDGWHDVLQSVFGERLVKTTRYRFASDSLSLDHIRRLAQANPYTAHVRQVDFDLANRLTEPYLDFANFDSPQDFVGRGIGFTLVDGDDNLGGAYSSLVASDAIEISIFVNFDHHRKGIATALACKLLEWCLERRIDPHWDAANKASCGLAEKLGYTPLGEYTAYFLKGVESK